MVDAPVDNGIDFLDLYLRTAKPRLTEQPAEGNRILR